MRHLLITLISLLVLSAKAEEKRVGDYIVYYNVFNSSFLQPETAKTYGIPRTGTTAVLNVSIHKVNNKHLPDAVSANVQGRAENQISQMEDLAFREIKEGEAIYYLADFQFRPNEYSKINFSIRLPDLEAPIELRVNKKFYKD